MLEDKKPWLSLSLALSPRGVADEETPESKVCRVLEMYQVGTGSLGYVAEKVGLSKRDLICEARTRGIEPPFDEQAVREDQQAIEMPGTDVSEDEKAWLNLSLTLAMRGMEDEEMPEYTIADLKERFSPV